MPSPARPIVHLELHTGNLPRACDFYTRLFRWRAERVDACSGSYLTLGPGAGIGGGIVECDAGRAGRALWLPYVEVEDVVEETRRARALGASVSLGPREGPAGWRSVVVAPDGGEVALWQPKERRASANSGDARRHGIEGGKQDE